MGNEREVTRMRAELEQAVRGNPWHGKPLTELLRGTTPAEAHAHPISGVQSVWEYVLHIAAWTREAASRLGGNVPGLPASGDWPSVPDTPTAAAWKAALADLELSHEELLAALTALDPAALDAPAIPTRDPSHGTGAKFRVLVHGVSQHHAYHGGQIALLRRAWAAGMTQAR